MLIESASIYEKLRYYLLRLALFFLFLYCFTKEKNYTRDPLIF
ncbi:hypothetical protein FH5_01364 [Priestia endophytica]|nr:hypothetical protein FH5_01364 [Priestia endophytica]